MHAFQRIGVLPEGGEQRLQPGIDGFDGLATHGAGGVDADVGEEASGHGVSLGGGRNGRLRGGANRMFLWFVKDEGIY